MGEGNGCECGRNYPILTSIEGRIQDYVVGEGGILMPLAPAVFNYHDLDWTGVEEFQVVQTVVGELELLLQLDKKFLRKMVYLFCAIYFQDCVCFFKIISKLPVNWLQKLRNQILGSIDI